MKIKLLLVDDEPAITSATRVLLDGGEYNIHVAANGNEALEILGKEQIDCVVSDIYMPDMDGMVLAENIRKVGADIPIIFYTGFGDDDLVRRALSVGAYEFVAKPDFEQLCNTIKQCINIL